jgi:glycosyltransferase involved in cell wall biosynthesis
MRAEIIERGVPAAKVAVVPNVVDVERFQPREKREDLLRSYGLYDRPVLGYVSNLGPREGIENLVEAVALLRDSGRDVAGLVVGDGPELETLRGLVDERGLGDDFVLTGHVTNQQIEDHYALIDVFVVPRIDDRAARLVTPLKPLEAMSMEIPVITSDLPALRELALPGERGEVFESGNPEALAEVAASLLDSSELRDRIVRQAKQWILAERTVESNARKYGELLGELVKGT